MARGKYISLYIRAKIREKRNEGLSISDLVKEFRVSRSTVLRSCKKATATPKKNGRPLLLSPAARRSLRLQARQNPTKSARVLANLAGICASVRTVQRELNRNGFQQVRVKKVPQVPPSTIAKRLAYAKEHLPKGAQFWDRVIFSDEKKWNLKGSDGYVSVWSEKSKTYTFETNLQRAPGVMVWGAICKNGGRYLQRISGKINAVAYQNLLENEIFGEDFSNLPENFIFQQDNAPAHAARTTQEFFKRKEIAVLPWPPYSPDLNIIENLWSIVSTKVYEGGKEYNNANELWESVCRQFFAISDKIIDHLFQSIPARLISVIELKGKRTPY